jgi:tRNA nucleotidyltransferase (CCA-adding enzyme)
MKIYLVGGAVRDELLGLPLKERDWVVVGAQPQELIDQGYRAVGKDFPVFLHPKTNEEYALARTERKTGPGYRGFETQFSPDVTLEQDLERRDLTLNAIAKDMDTGALTDPFDGVRDLNDKVLRHVSDAFVEDPVRVLRVARFAARFAPLGFTVAPQTNALMREIAARGELHALVSERVWQELHKALQMPAPWKFFDVLREADALPIIFPEIDALFGVPQPEKWHPEIDAGIHTMMVLEQACRLSSDPIVRFAALVHDLGKGTTPKNEWPKHVAHEHRSVPLIEKMCSRMKIPNAFRDLAVVVGRHHLVMHKALEVRPGTLLELLEHLDAFRRPERVEQFILACEADARGRKGLENRDYPQSDLVRRAHAAARAAKVSEEARAGLSGEQIAERFRQARVRAIAEVMKSASETDTSN